MALSHIQNSKAGRDLHEPVTGNLFRITMIPPKGVINSEILTEAVLSVSGWKKPGPENIQQQFQTSRRNSASSDVDQTQKLAIVFQLNLDQQNSYYIYNILSSWKNKVYNDTTGEEGRKIDYFGKMIIESYNRAGFIFWTRTLHNIWPVGGFEGLENDYTQGEAQKLTTNWISDYYTEATT